MNEKDLTEVKVNEMQAILDNEQAEKDAAALAYMLTDEAGRWFLMRLFERCHMLSTTFPDEGNTNQMMVWEGERRVALNILGNINLMGEKYLELKQEAEREYNSFHSRAAYLMQLAEQNEKGDSNNGFEEI